MNPSPVISGMVDGKRVSVQLNELRRISDLTFIRSACQLVEQKIVEINPRLNVAGMWSDNDLFNAVLTFLLNRSTPATHLLYEYTVALRKMLKLLETERLEVMRSDAHQLVGGAA